MYDLHMHTNCCDGKHSPEEMVIAAIERGMPIIGLSGHSNTWFDESYCMTPEATERYISEVNALKKKYEGQIRVLLGIELDYWAEIDRTPYDYIIGSGHYILKDGVYVDSDDTAEHTLEEIGEFFGGDPMTMAEHYYKQLEDIVSRTTCDVIGHFDLITKFNERYGVDDAGKVIDRWAEDGSCADPGRDIFDTSDPRYIRAWKSAVDHIFDETRTLRADLPNRLEALGVISCGDKPVFEINTGGISKGYKKNVYPASDQMEYIRSKGGVLILSSDSHSRDQLCYKFEKFKELL